ncbi:MAG: hypothetical protein H6679_02630 [Epsilonproteobacteria bacterium]|nr:hypothetical protein [Campylobacterota bacterium]
MGLKKFFVNGKSAPVSVVQVNDMVAVEHNDKKYQVELIAYDVVTGRAVVRANGQQYVIFIPCENVNRKESIDVSVNGNMHVVEQVNVRSKKMTMHGAQKTVINDVELVSPVTGKVIRILTQAGKYVSKSQPLVVIESMKMENEICAQVDGFVKTILISEGNVVRSGQRLVEFDCKREGDGDAKYEGIKETSQSR